MDITNNTKSIITKYFYESFNKIHFIRSKTLNNFFTDYPEIAQELNYFLSNHPEYQKTVNIIYCILKNIELSKCNICGQTLTFKATKLHRRYCSTKCQMQDEELREKTKQSCIEKYGSIENYKKKVVESCAKTNLQKYGSPSPFGNKEVRQKCEKTMQERFGAAHPFQNPEILQKAKETCKQNYGAENPFQSEKIKEKIKTTNMNKYGFSHPRKNPQYMKELSEQIFNKTGYYNYKCTPECREKTSLLMKHKHYLEILNMSQYVEPLFTEEEYQGYNVNHRWKCKQCGNEFVRSLEVPIEINNIKIPRCPVCYPFKINGSYSEDDLFNYIKENFDNECIQHDKKLLHKMELDIYSKKFNIAIEYDGLYWHSDDKKKNTNYHLNKTIQAENKKTTLIHIWENEWEFHQDKIKQKIQSYFISQEIQLIFGIIDKNTAELFYNQYSFKNFSFKNTNLYVGGYNNNVLYSVACINLNNNQCSIISYQSSDQSDSTIMQLSKYLIQQNYIVSIYNDKRYPMNKWIDKDIFKFKSILPPVQHFFNKKHEEFTESNEKTVFSIHDCGIEIFNTGE